MQTKLILRMIYYSRNSEYACVTFWNNISFSFIHQAENIPSHLFNKTNFQMKSFALSLAVIMRFTATRKWSVSVESHLCLLWFCFSTLCDWSAKLAPIYPLMKQKTITTRSHAFSRAWRRWHVFASSSDWFIAFMRCLSLMWLARLITLILVLPLNWLRK